MIQHACFKPSVAQTAWVHFLVQCPLLSLFHTMEPPFRDLLQRAKPVTESYFISG